jgi:hypothetical protein
MSDDFVAAFVVGLVVGMIFIGIVSWLGGMSAEDEIGSSTAALAQAYELTGFKTVSVDKDSFIVMNLSDGKTDFGTIFVSTHQIRNGFINFSGPAIKTRRMPISKDKNGYVLAAKETLRLFFVGKFIGQE